MISTCAPMICISCRHKKFPRRSVCSNGLDVLQRGALDLGEIAVLRLREFGVVDRLRRDLGDEPGDLALGRAKARRRPFIEALAELAYCRIAAFGDIGDDRLNRAPDFGVGFFLSAGERPILGRAAHHA